MGKADAALIVIHGSRDPRPRLELEKLLDQLHQAWPDYRFGGGLLEGDEKPLAEQIQDFCAQAPEHHQVAILPLFLLPGIHVAEDLPAAVTQAQATLPQALTLLPFFGDQPGIRHYLGQRMQSDSDRAWILLAHGSRRAQAQAWIAHLATQLQAQPAYLNQPESLTTAIQTLTAQGHSQIQIFPYFLFPGQLLNRVNEQINVLQAEFPQAQLTQAHGFQADPTMVNLVAQALYLS